MEAIVKNEIKEAVTKAVTGAVGYPTARSVPSKAIDAQLAAPGRHTHTHTHTHKDKDKDTQRRNKPWIGCDHDRWQ